MNQTNGEKIVDFTFCRTCKYWNNGDEEDPKCEECLNYPTNTYSVKPINYSEIKEENKKGENNE